MLCYKNIDYSPRNEHGREEVDHEEGNEKKVKKKITPQLVGAMPYGLAPTYPKIAGNENMLRGGRVMPHIA